MLIVLTTVPAGDEGRALAHSIVGARVAACVQILPNIRSVYRWRDEVQDEQEELLLIKTTDQRYEELAASSPKIKATMFRSIGRAAKVSDLLPG